MIDYCSNLTDNEVNDIIHGNNSKIPYINNYLFLFKRLPLTVEEEREVINIILNYKEKLNDLTLLERIKGEMLYYTTTKFAFAQSLLIPILYILVDKNKIVYDKNYKFAFNIIISALKYYPDVNKYMDIRELNDIRDKHIHASVDGKFHLDRSFHKNTDVIMYSLYLISFGYYYDIPRHEVDEMLDIFHNEYDTIVDLCIMNGMEYIKTSINTIDKDYYPFITNYIRNRLDKKIIK